MTRALAVVLLAGALAPAAGASSKTGFAFGRTGGNIRPYTVTVSTTGKVTATEVAPEHVASLTKLELANLNRVAYTTQFATLPTFIACPSALPDVAAEFIRVGARTVRSHGACNGRFNRLWRALNAATSS
jgi:hypothetical protein